jgi:threonine dehydrogenase-like Zn-dependent dehydrogenase
MAEIPRPRPPAPGWVLVRPTLAGIAGADIALLRGAAWVGRRCVPGREVVGVVEEVHGTRWAREGHRVLIEPNAGCVIRGFPVCERCAAGETALCENSDRDSPLGPGADAGVEHGGGWSEGILAHEEMLVPADGISDQRAVLGVSLATAIHAVLRWSRRGDRAVVIGSGTTTRLAVAALNRLHPDVDITVIVDARGPERAGRRRRVMPGHLGADERVITAAIEELGAARVWRGGPEQLVDAAADLMQARRLRLPGEALPRLDRGFDAVFDCRGTSASLALGLRLLRPSGSLVLAGPAARLDLDWTVVSARGLTIVGSGGFGIEPAGWRTFAAVREWLTDPSFPVDTLVTHRYPLDASDAAIATAAAGEAVGAVKVVFEGPSSPLRAARVAAEAIEPEPDQAAPVLLATTAARARRDDDAES